MALSRHGTMQTRQLRPPLSCPRLLAVAALYAVVSMLPAAGAVISLDTTSASAVGAGPSGAAVPGVLGQNVPGSSLWNVYTEADNATSKAGLIDEDGHASATSFRCDSVSYAAYGGTADFFYGYTYLQGSGTPGPQVSSTLSFGELIPGTNYTLAFYATWAWKDAGTTFVLGGVTNTCQGVPSVSGAPLTEGLSYVVFSNVTADAEGDIHVDWISYNPEEPTPEGDPPLSSNGGHRGIISAVQIAGAFAPYEPPPPPEPTGAMGTPFGWLNDFGFDTNAADQAEADDPDGDGRLTWYEYQTGTDPTNGSDFAGIDLPDKPNIVVVMVDDAGLGDFTSFHPPSLVQTPNLDTMATNGMIFSRAYSGAPYCAPARSTLMTGFHTGHGSVRGNLGGTTIRDGDVTVAEILKKAGYATGGFGKWGIGAVGTPGAPHLQGFDLFYGYCHQIHAHNHYTTYVYRNGVAEELPGNSGAPGSGYVHPRYSHTQNLVFREMKQFIKTNALAGQRFFAYGPWNPPHGNYQIPADDPAAIYQGVWGHQNSEVSAAFATMADRQIGELIDLLGDPDEDGNTSDSILSETLFVVMSDNGGYDGGVVYDRNPGLRGAKGSVFEGGVRVPMWAYWPGVIPAGYASPRLTYFPDFMATFAELGKVTTALPDIDGVSFAGHLTGRTLPVHPPFLYFEQRSPNYGGGSYGVAIPQGVVKGWWKGYRNDLGSALQLYDLQSDPGEAVNVAASHPGVAADLESILDAEHETEWPQYDPSKNQPRWEVAYGIRPEPVGFHVVNASFEDPALSPADPNDGKYLNDGATGWSGGFIQHPGNVILAGDPALFNGNLPDGAQCGGLEAAGITSAYTQNVKELSGADMILYLDDLYRQWSLSLHVGRRLTGTTGAATLRVELVGGVSGFTYFEGTFHTGVVPLGEFQPFTVALPPTDVPGGYQSADDLGNPWILRVANDGDGGQIFIDGLTLSAEAYSVTPPETSLGVPHWWLETHGLGTNDLEAAQLLDQDGDTVVTADEYVTSTRPLDNADYLRIVPDALDTGNGELTASWEGRAGRSYVVETNPVAAGAGWTLAHGPVAVEVDATQTAAIPNPAGEDLFLRIEASLQ